MKLVFMGTPAFAVPSLNVLHQSEHEVLACVTAPDRPAGRGRKITESEIKQYCLQHNIKVLQPENLKANDFAEDLRALNADMFIVVAFRMLPEIIWSIPPKGTINLHASLLPAYRGAAPINWAIINGEKKSGLTTFIINSAIDSGDILLQEEIDISEHDHFGSLHNKMMNIGANLLLRTIQNIDILVPKKQLQNESHEKSAPKLNRENTCIDWNKTNIQIHNQIRGLSPFPGAWTECLIHNQRVQIKIIESAIIDQTVHLKAGSFYTVNKNELGVACGSGMLKITQAQIQGKKLMNMSEILRGYSDSFTRGRFIFAE